MFEIPPIRPAMTLPLGNLVRLTPLHLDEIPAHPSIPNFSGVGRTDGANASNGTSTGTTLSKGRPDLQAFLKAILDEARTFIEAYPSLAQSAGTKAAQPSTAKVDLLKCQVSGSELSSVPWQSSAIQRTEPSAAEKNAGEFWVARHSVHEDADTKGSASWEQFEFGLREDHSKHEQDFTPTLYDARTILDWTEQLQPLNSTVGEYGKVHMHSKI